MHLCIFTSNLVYVQGYISEIVVGLFVNYFAKVFDSSQSILVTAVCLLIVCLSVRRFTIYR